MARIKLSALLGDVRGKLSGSYFQKGLYGLQVGQKSNPLFSRSFQQSLTRQDFSFLARSWRYLSVAERSSYENAATEGITPYRLFQSRNIPRLVDGLAYNNTFVPRSNLAVIGVSNFQLSTAGVPPVSVMEFDIVFSKDITSIPLLLRCNIARSLSAGHKPNPRLYDRKNVVGVSVNSNILHVSITNLRGVNAQEDPLTWIKNSFIQGLIKVYEQSSGALISHFPTPVFQVEHGIPNQPLFLDFHPGVLYGYSLRKLKRSYNGPCIRVRDATTKEQKDFYFANDFLDVSALEDWSNGHTLNVVIWYNQTGGQDAKVQAQKFAPRIVKNGTINKDPLGNPSLNFISGHGFVIENSSDLDLAINPRFHAVAAGFPDVTKTNSTLLARSHGTVWNDSSFAWMLQGSSPYYYNRFRYKQNPSASITNVTGTNINPSGTQILSVNTNAGTNLTLRNGTLIHNNFPLPSFTPSSDMLTIGGQNKTRLAQDMQKFYKGDLSELIVWPFDMSLIGKDLNGELKDYWLP